MKLNPRATNKPKADFLFEMEKEFFILQSLDDSAANDYESAQRSVRETD
jgi:hypothetical protein